MKDKRKRIAVFTLLGVAALMTFGVLGYRALQANRYHRYADSFFDTFDTVVTVVAYTRSEQEFREYFDRIQARFRELHKLYDIYNDYPGINNIKTINDNAGVRPVTVSKEIIDLLKFALEWHSRTTGKTNIAMGPVLRIWHDYREEGKAFPEEARIPPMEVLREAAKHTDISKIVIDEDKSTVYLADRNMSLDVGAVAKGFATELVAREIESAGLRSGLISAGGNVRCIGTPPGGPDRTWAVGIQYPSTAAVPSQENLLDIIDIPGGSVAASGSYQRYYVVDGRTYHHIIDPETLMPADFYLSVTIWAPDAGVADFLSTEAFLLPYESSRSLVESLPGVEALWVMPDGRVLATPGMSRVMRSLGNRLQGR